MSYSAVIVEGHVERDVTDLMLTLELRLWAFQVVLINEPAHRAKAFVDALAMFDAPVDLNDGSQVVRMSCVKPAVSPTR